MERIICSFPAFVELQLRLSCKDQAITASAVQMKQTPKVTAATQPFVLLQQHLSAYTWPNSLNLKITRALPSVCQRLSWIKQSANKLRVKHPFQRRLCTLLARFYAWAKQAVNAVTQCFTRRKPKKTNVELGTDSQRSCLGFTGETESRGEKLKCRYPSWQKFV